jgi:hypothetical protein
VDSTVIIAIVSAIAAVAAAAFVLIKGLGENKNTEISNKTAIDMRIDKRVKEELDDAWESIDELRADMQVLIEADRNTKSIVRRWFRELIGWDRMGRSGDMPLPTPEDMRKLDIDPNESIRSAHK